MQSVINGGRHYEIDGGKLPSVTTILSATQSPEKKASLDAWKAKMGDKIADQSKCAWLCRARLLYPLSGLQFYHPF